jgi:hypothetical protein
VRVQLAEIKVDLQLTSENALYCNLSVQPRRD